MEIINYQDKYLDQIVEIWNMDVAPQSIYKSFTKEKFVKHFINHPLFDPNLFLILKKDEEVIGFGHGAYQNLESTTPGFITFVVVKNAFQRQGFGTKMLHELELRLKKLGKKFIRELFLNPFQLEWYIPGHEPHDHPNAPAIPYHSPFYFFLINNGYIIDGQNQDAFYQDIRKYKLPKHIEELNCKNMNDGYYITEYDPNKHHGFEALFKALNNDLWLQTVNNNLALKNPLKMLVVHKDGEILGWTGPLKTENSKRGYFAGIGIHPNAQGRGLGKSLFAELILHSKNNGAHFMTLFTGSQNPARKIYLNAGFKIVESFAIMRKDL